MITISCDVCKKKMDDPQYGRNFFYYASHSVCESCKDSLELNIKNAIRSRDPFEINWFEKYVTDSLDKAAQKGKA
ncbi:MAG: hypothetical protein FWC19_00270 [Treponema sp.]|nr:hypothetical protein [Treponema sp.]